MGVWPSEARAADLSRQESGLAKETASQERLDHLVEQLGSEKYAERRVAEKELLRIGTDAFDALQKALDHDDLEIASRAQYLIHKIEIRWTRSTDSRAVRSLLRDYADADEDERQALITRLAALPNDEGLEGLCRVARFERSISLSNLAALLIIQGQGIDSTQRAKRGEVITRELGISNRPAASWLRNYLAMAEDPDRALRKWTEIFQREKQRLVNEADRTALLSRLMYTVAASYQERGATETAAQMSSEAFDLSQDDARSRLSVATMLERQGMFDWAEREYRQVLKLGPDNGRGIGGITTAEFAARNLSSMLYDQLRELDAARVLEEQFKTPTHRSSYFENARAQMEYLFAAHYAKEKNWEKHREHLENALKLDPTHADVLIAMYRFPQADEAYRKRTKELIQKAAVQFEQQIQKVRTAEDKYSAYNQWAWLIGNTEGDFDKAIRYSRASIELARRGELGESSVAGFLDTLGRCYYANGDYVNAVKSQQQALDLEPHSKLLARQLDLFKKALAAKESEKVSPKKPAAGGPADSSVSRPKAGADTRSEAPSDSNSGAKADETRAPATSTDG